MKLAAFDLATCSGFAIGDISAAQPHFGSKRFGKHDCSRLALFGDALRWFNATLIEHKPEVVAFEEPLHFGLRRGNSQAGNDELAYGLPAILQAVCYLRGCYEVRQVRTSEVRQFFIRDNPKRVIAKRETMRHCLAMGFAVEDDNAADAIATWFFVAAQIKPELGLRVSPLFNKARIASVWP